MFDVPADNNAISRGGGFRRLAAQAVKGSRSGRARTPRSSPGGELRGVVNAWTLSVQPTDPESLICWTYRRRRDWRRRTCFPHGADTADGAVRIGGRHWRPPRVRTNIRSARCALRTRVSPD